MRSRRKPPTRFKRWLAEPTLEQRRLDYRARRLRGSKKYLLIGAGGAVLGTQVGKSGEQEQGMERPKALVRKSDDDRRKAGAALTAGGGMGVLLGTVASGVPGFKAKPGTSAIRRAPAGILGGRYASHTDVTNKMSRQAGATGKGHMARFKAARSAGKVGAEHKVLGELKSGYKLGRKGQAAGAALLGTGLLVSASGRKSEGSQSQSQSSGTGPAAVAGGAGLTAAGAYGTGRALQRKSGEWAARGQRSAAEANRIVPGSYSGRLGERELKRAAGRRRNRASNIERAGRMSGDARQSKYLAYAYRANAKAFKGVGAAAAGIAALGAGAEAKRRAGSKA